MSTYCDHSILIGKREIIVEAAGLEKWQSRLSGNFPTKNMRN